MSFHSIAIMLPWCILLASPYLFLALFLRHRILNLILFLLVIYPFLAPIILNTPDKPAVADGFVGLDDARCHFAYLVLLMFIAGSVLRFQFNRLIFIAIEYKIAYILGVLISVIMLFYVIVDLTNHSPYLWQVQYHSSSYPLTSYGYNSTPPDAWVSFWNQQFEYE